MLRISPDSWITKMASRAFLTISAAPGTMTGAGRAVGLGLRPNQRVAVRAKRTTQRQPRVMLRAFNEEGCAGAATEAVAVMRSVNARFATRDPAGELRYGGSISKVFACHANEIAGLVAIEDREICTTGGGRKVMAGSSTETGGGPGTIV